jgi:hypothetical protein
METQRLEFKLKEIEDNLKQGPKNTPDSNKSSFESSDTDNFVVSNIDSLISLIL